MLSKGIVLTLEKKCACARIDPLGPNGNIVGTKVGYPDYPLAHFVPFYLCCVFYQCLHLMRGAKTRKSLRDGQKLIEAGLQ